MKTIKVIYKGARDGKDYDDFTYNQTYLAQPLTEGFVLVLNDRGTLVEMPTIDFDFNTNGYSRNWLAYCKHNNLHSDHKPQSMANFINWINDRSIEFRKRHHFSKEQPIGHLESWVLFLEKGAVAIEHTLTEAERI